jgi:serine/threonine protein kinase
MPLDARTDVFSAGIILHEMLTTEKLFRGDTEFALMERVRKAEIPPPSNFNRRVTPELNSICLKALARDVGDRYQSAAKLAEALDVLIAGYRFDPKELRQFLRQMFRKEYTQELQDAELAMTSLPTELITEKDTDSGVVDSPSGQFEERESANIANVATEVLPSNGSSANIKRDKQDRTYEADHLTPEPITEPNMLGPAQSLDETPLPTKGFWNLWKKRK